MSEPVAIALIGCGGQGRSHAHGYEVLWDSERRPFRIVACCDVDDAKAQHLAETIAEWQGDPPATFTDVEKLLDGATFDAADICTPHRFHHEHAVAALQAGKHVTVEKPLAITMRAGKLVLDAAEAAGRHVQVAENYRRTVEHRAVKWAIEQGRIGQPWMVTWCDVFERLWHWGWRERKLEAGGGWSLDGGVHFADLFRYHLGDIDTLYGTFRAFHPERFRSREDRQVATEVDVEDTTTAVLNFATGAVGTWVHSNAGIGDELRRRMIHGSEGSVTFGEGITAGGTTITSIELLEEFKSAISLDENERLFPGGVTNPVSIELYEFILACEGAGEIETDALSGYKAQAVAFGVYESGVAGRAVSTAEIENLELETYQQPINESLGLT